MSFAQEYKSAKSRFENGARLTVRTDWTNEVTSLEQLQRWFTGRLDEKINRHDSRRYRKLDSDYQRALRQDRSDIDAAVNRRVRIYQLRTPELSNRFAHVLADRNDD